MSIPPRQEIESGTALVQGAYYLVTGVWPFISMPAFEAVTGKKKEWWLVKTVGALVAVVGGTLLLAGRRGEVSPDLRRVAVGSAAALGGVSAYYAAKGRISPVYFADAVAEAGLLGSWLLASSRRSDSSTARGDRGAAYVEEQSRELELEEGPAPP